MKLTDEQRSTIVSLEYEKANNIFSQIKELQKLGYWDNVANRLYYSIFHAATALMIFDGHTVNTHKGLVQQFGLHYVTTGKFSIEEGKLYSQLQTLREQYDYNCYFSADEIDIVAKITETELFIKHIGKYIKLLN